MKSWPGGKTVGRVDSARLAGSGLLVVEQRFYLSSGELSAAALTQAVRRHSHLGGISPEAFERASA
ncbi:hypothetical protein [Chromobacterium violaceum]